jgi:AcrR family transcriptional regulator
MSEAKKSKILLAARSVFLRYGYRRVSMNDIAEAADLSRAALYLSFRNKEDVFIGAFEQWLDETIAEIAREMPRFATPKEKMRIAFEIWAVRPFELTTTSAEAKELVECSFDFAQASLRQGYKKFEAALVPVLASQAERHPGSMRIGPEKTAHVLANAVHGFKQAASTPADLRSLIDDLLTLSLP